MPNKLTHFAIHIDNMERAKSFYEEVFDWGFASYGPPDFLQIKTDKTDKGELIGALQSRKYSPVKEKLIGLECTINVADIEDIIKKVKHKGGQILMPKTAIPYVGWIIKFLDTEGNLVCAMQTDAGAK
ncbi:MAG TPA: VOC family protein [Chitinophagaceae bacterium]|nr:VOC family protein [Chitinophagaceae bacterium]